MPGFCDVKMNRNKKTSSREGHQWFIMSQRASVTVILKLKVNILMINVLPNLLFFHCKKANIIIMPKYISISDKSLLFSGCPTAKLGTK